jgi:predicted Zn finger-like uncharacterized protein
MDVRCEKCQTEYELDESQLKPGGVTVKCTQCGHMFKIRARGSTSGGNGAADPDRTRNISSDRLSAGRASTAGGVPRASTSDFGSGPSAESMWIIRLDNGETDDLVTTYTYTPQGLIDLITDPLGRVTDLDYDLFGRLTSVTYALGTPDEASRGFEYDLAGNTTAVIDERREQP